MRRHGAGGDKQGAGMGSALAEAETATEAEALGCEVGAPASGTSVAALDADGGTGTVASTVGGGDMSKHGRGTESAQLAPKERPATAEATNTARRLRMAARSSCSRTVSSSGASPSELGS